MSEFRQKVDTYRVSYVCDSCRSGLMLATGIVLTSNPPQYPHVCTKCSATKTFHVRYPVTTQEVGDLW